MGFQSFSKETRFEELCCTVKHCSLCQRLKERKPVLSKANGNIFAKVLLIAEAPGRLGADITGVPLFGDQTGDNFEELLDEIRWHRENLFMTNAILCNPRDQKGNNSTPTSEEIANCGPYLEMAMELVEPEVVVTLGAVALEALKNIRIHSYVLKEHVGQFLPWNSRILMPLYHPAPRARVHRSFEEQKSDFMRLAELVDPKEGIVEKRYRELYRKNESFHDFQRLAYAIVESLGSITYFKLTKLLYLVDLNALERLGRTLTGEIYVRQKEGPWPPKLRKMIEPLEGREIGFFFRRRNAMVEPGPSPRMELNFKQDELAVIEDVLRRYGQLDNAGIKIATYRTQPMRYIRAQEKSGRNMLNLPVIYKNKVVPELIV